MAFHLVADGTEVFGVVSFGGYGIECRGSKAGAYYG
jgi:hypothetical protein